MKELNSLEKTVCILFDVLYDVVHYGAAIDEGYAKERLERARTYLLESVQPQQGEGGNSGPSGPTAGDKSKSSDTTNEHT